MKAHRLRTTSVRLVTALSCLSILLVVGSAVRVNAQCKTPAVLSGRELGWKTGVTVQVNIDPAYDTNQRNALAAAFTNWNNATDLKICPNVKFGTPTYNQTPIAGPTITTGNSSTPKYQVFKKNPPDVPTDRALTLGAEDGTYTALAWSYLNTSVTLPAALTQLMAHEIGHTMGLGECANCGDKASLMNTPASGGYNGTAGLTGPTSCDLAAVKQFFACPYSGSNTYMMTIYAGSETWLYRYGVAVSLTQTSPGVVSILLGWRESGYAPSPYVYPPSINYCNLKTTDMVSRGASISFANGATFSTANNTLATKYLPLYGHDYTGTYKGNLTDLGNNPSATIDVSVTVTGCGTRSFSLTPSSYGVTLK